MADVLRRSELAGLFDPEAIAPIEAYWMYT
jgi:hypothetical protein